VIGVALDDYHAMADISASSGGSECSLPGNLPPDPRPRQEKPAGSTKTGRHSRSYRTSVAPVKRQNGERFPVYGVVIVRSTVIATPDSTGSVPC
jgi:hypothetical protein